MALPGNAYSVNDVPADQIIGELFEPETITRKKPRIISREEWGAKEPRTKVPTSPPFMRVFYTLYTETSECFTEEECTRTVQELQRRHMEEKGLSDIKYNFLVGGDGNVYEGRGWHVKSARCMEFNPGFYDQRVDIAYIGDFRNTPNPPFSQLELGLDLLSYAEWLKHIHATRDVYKLQGDKEVGPWIWPPLKRTLNHHG